jgi:hypothetical protein
VKPLDVIGESCDLWTHNKQLTSLGRRTERTQSWSAYDARWLDHSDNRGQGEVRPTYRLFIPESGIRKTTRTMYGVLEASVRLHDLL